MPAHPPPQRTAPTSSATESPASDLQAEQDYLVRARADLARMRAAAQRLDASRASDAVSGEALAATLARRVSALQDDPRTALFFGRLDRVTDTSTDPERHYIGRRHVSDSHGDPVVLDWRAPISTAFYQASPTEPMGVLRRRRFGVADGRITAMEDENLSPSSAFDPDLDPQEQSGGSLLAAEIERPRTGPMRDIVATIQPEQDAIVRADLGLSMCIQGAPGTGKTAVGLHRAAWLLYTFRERLARTGVLVVGPSAAFLEHIGAVLPSLGEIRVQHSTAVDLVAHAALRGTDTAAGAAVKADIRMAGVLRAAVWAQVRPAQEALVVPRGARKWRVPAYDVQEIVDELRERGVRYDAARAMLPKRLAHAVLLRMERAGDSPDDRVQDTVARSAAVRRYADQVWPRIDAAQVLFSLWSSAEALRAAADTDLTPDEQAALLWPKPPRSKGAARWTAADLVLLDEIEDLLERTPSVGHIVLDEAQDLSPMQLRAIGRRSSTGTVTVLGDLAQGTTPWATGSWQESMAHLGKPDFHLEVLDRGFRVPAAVLDYASQLLPTIAPGLASPSSVRSDPGRLAVRSVSEQKKQAAVVDAARSGMDDEGTLGVIAADDVLPRIAKALARESIRFGLLDGTQDYATDCRVQLVPATVAKGLEFDRVIVLEPAQIAAAEPDERSGLRRLYVVLTRAVSELTVLHVEPLPPQLTGH